MNRLKIADFAEVITGGTPNTSKKEYWENGNIPWLQSGACQNCVITECNTFITEMGLKNSSAKMMQPDSVLIALTGATTGKVGYLTFKACANQSVTGIQPNERFLPKYLYFYLLGIRQKILADSYGGAQKHISQGYVKNIEVPLGTLAEQQIIVKNFEKINSIINNYKEKLKYLDLLIKARFVEMFYDKNYPKSTISELAVDKVSSVKKDFQPSDIIKYIDISSIDNEKNIMTGYTEYVLSKAPSRAQQHIIKDDIVISTVRPNLHNVAMTTYTDNNLVASSGFCVLRAVKCIPEYLMAIVVSDNFTDAMSKIVTGANYPAIKNSDIMNYIVSVPPIEKQEEFASFVKQVDKSKFVKINLVIYDNII